MARVALGHRLTRTGRRMSRPSAAALKRRRNIAAGASFFGRDVRAVGASLDGPGRPAQTCGKAEKLRREQADRERNRGSQSAGSVLRAIANGVRRDSGPIALRAFWSMHVEAMNWGGWGSLSMPLRSVCRLEHCGFGAIVSKTPMTKWTGDLCFIRARGRN